MVAGDSNEVFNGAMLEFLARQFAAGGRRTTVSRAVPDEVRECRLTPN
jgi:hypothetical protein